MGYSFRYFLLASGTGSDESDGNPLDQEAAGQDPPLRCQAKLVPADIGDGLHRAYTSSWPSISCINAYNTSLCCVTAMPCLLHSRRNELAAVCANLSIDDKDYRLIEIVVHRKEEGKEEAAVDEAVP